MPIPRIQYECRFSGLCALCRALGDASQFYLLTSSCAWRKSCHLVASQISRCCSKFRLSLTILLLQVGSFCPRTDFNGHWVTLKAQSIATFVCEWTCAGQALWSFLILLSRPSSCTVCYKTDWQHRKSVFLASMQPESLALCFAVELLNWLHL